MSKKTIELMQLVVHLDDKKAQTDFDLSINPGFEQQLKGKDRLVVMANAKALVKSVAEAVRSQMGMPEGEAKITAFMRRE